MKKMIPSTILALALLVSLHRAAAQGTMFTYQGHFTDGSAPANGSYDLEFSLFKVSVGDSAVAGPITNSPVAVSNGLFTTTIDFGAGIFEGTTFWLQIAVRTNGSGAFTELAPRQELTPTPYAIYAATAPVAPNSVNAGHIIDGQVGNADLAANAVTTGKILDGTITSADIADGTLTTSDLSLASVDARYVLKAGDTMTGKLTAQGGIATSSITNDGGILSLKSRTDIELQIDNGGGAAAAFEIFNGLGNHLFLLGETGNARTFGNHFVDAGFGVGTTTLDANAVAQFNLPSSVSVPHVRIKSPLSDAGFGLQFVNPIQTWYVGPNIGNWDDGRFNIMVSGSNKGLIVATNGNVGIDSVSGASPFATLTVDGTIGFPTVSTPAMYIYPSGTSNPEKRLIVHSPAFPEYGLYYSDPGDQFVMKSSAADGTPSLVVDLDSNWVTIATDTPKPGYELSVNGQIVCEEILVQDSSLWPDYVFQEGYPLKPLDEVEAHIKERKHLPGIPTAKEVAANGISVGDMQKRTMEKIEELTLYVIAQNKRLTAQEKLILELQAKLEEAKPLALPSSRHPAAELIPSSKRIYR